MNTTRQKRPDRVIDNSKKIILDLCGGTGSWSKPYKDAGYDVRNITLPEYDVRNWRNIPEVMGASGEVYGILAAPPCQMFSDARTHAKLPRDLEAGMEIVKACLEVIWYWQYRIVSDQQKYSPLKFWALENPWYGRLKWFIGNPNFVFDPWEFEDLYKKKTALWGYFKHPVKTVFEKNGKLKKFDRLLVQELRDLKSKIWSEDFVNTKTRQTIRAITPQGFAYQFFKANQ